MKLKVAIAAANKAVKIIRKDAANRYVLEKPLYVGRFKIPVPDYDDDYILIIGRKLYLKVLPAGHKPIVDGASLFPDKVCGLDIAKAYFAHDYGYVRMEAIAKAWAQYGWTVARVRKLFDVMFHAVLTAEAKRQKKERFGKPMTDAIYSVLRVFGGIFHTSRAPSILLFALSFGCILILSGCCHAPDWFEPSEDVIEYRKVESAK